MNMYQRDVQNGKLPPEIKQRFQSAFVKKIFYIVYNKPYEGRKLELITSCCRFCMKHIREDSDDEFFCSEMVAFCYKRMGKRSRAVA
jgi:hypothetical protein